MAAQINIEIPQKVGFDLPKNDATKPKITGINPKVAPIPSPPAESVIPAPIIAPQVLAQRMFGNEINAPIIPKIIGVFDVPR